MPDRSFVLTVSCPDRVGIVHAVSGWAADRGLTITDAQQFGDASSGEFHLRMELAPTAGGSIEELRASFAPVVTGFIVDTTHSFQLALIICGCVTALGALAYIFLVLQPISDPRNG